MFSWLKNKISHHTPQEKTNVKTRIVAIAKDESAYLPTWIHHHLYFGFDEIEIYVNNTSDNSELILDKIGKKYPVKYISADFMFKDPKCIVFQKYVYEKAYLKAKEEDVSHLIFLDIDEFWTPLDFKSNIQECLSELASADIISFEWVFKRNEEQPFIRPFTCINSVNKNHLVKSIFKTSIHIDEVHIHNVIAKGSVNLLANGQPHPKPYSYSVDNYNINLSPIKKYFIFHRMWRSQLEYIYILGQGMKAAVTNPESSTLPFKTNRVGYLLPGNRITALDLDTNLIEQQEVDYQRFIADCDLKDSIRDAQYFVLKQSINILEQLKEHHKEPLVEQLLTNVDLAQLESQINISKKQLSFKE